MDNIRFFNTAISPSAIDTVSEVLQSTLLSEGDVVAEFEAALTTRAGMVNPVAVNSGTSALHLALLVAGIGKGDEVIIPSQTFIATGLVVLMVGATPVFADIQYETGNIDPIDVQSKITSKTKAIIPVHWGGYPCDLDELKAIAVHHDLLIIEDAAHAIGAVYRNKMIGSISDMSCFSFQAIKHLTTGDGGALACNDLHYFNSAMRLRWFGIDRNNSPVNSLGEREYNLAEVGYKYHMNNLAAALGIANLPQLRANLKRRREIAAYYIAELKSSPGISLFNYQNDRESAYWLFGFHVSNRPALIQKLKAEGIPSSVVHSGIHKNAIFKNDGLTLKAQRKFDKTQIHIPVHNDLKDEQVTNIARTITSGW